MNRHHVFSKYVIIPSLCIVSHTSSPHSSPSIDRKISTHTHPRTQTYTHINPESHRPWMTNQERKKESVTRSLLPSSSSYGEGREGGIRLIIFYIRSPCPILPHPFPPLFELPSRTHALHIIYSTKDPHILSVGYIHLLIREMNLVDDVSKDYPFPCTVQMGREKKRSRLSQYWVQVIFDLLKDN